MKRTRNPERKKIVEEFLRQIKVGPCPGEIRFEKGESLVIEGSDAGVKMRCILPADRFSFTNAKRMITEVSQEQGYFVKTKTYRTDTDGAFTLAVWRIV